MLRALKIPRNLLSLTIRIAQHSESRNSCGRMSPMFGAEKGDVIAHLECPRCNAQAVVRGLQRVNTQAIVCHITCSKCHLIRFCGFTSVESLIEAEAMKRLKKKRAQATRKVDQMRIDRKIQLLEERMKLHELGL